MNRFIARLSKTAIVAALLVPGTAAAAPGHAASHDRPPGRSARAHRVHWINQAPPIKIGTPECLAGRCVFPSSETGVTHGDLVGTYVSAGGAAITSPTRFDISRIDVFVGTIRHCGTGLITIASTEIASATGGTGRWSVVHGAGTGDLANVRGHGVGTGTVAPDGSITARLSGVLRCGR